MSLTQSKPIEIFCGTGGVGKTTLATARAYALAKSSQKILLMTIDPAKRLKQLLKLEDSDAGEVKTIPINLFSSSEVENQGTFDALLMSPRATLNRIIAKERIFNATDNRILSILSKPYGGMNEILGLIELRLHLESKQYDTIILDTPPGQHFIDFLGNSLKFEKFFQQKYVEIFETITKRVLGKAQKSFLFSPVNHLVKATIGKLLTYLEKVTGQSFLQEFIETIDTIYAIKKPFVETFQFQQTHLKQNHFAHWFLVTSAEQDKIDDALKLKEAAQEFIGQSSTLLVNRCLSPYINGENTFSVHSQEERLIKGLLSRESHLLEEVQKNFSHRILFPDLLNENPIEQIETLASFFNKESPSIEEHFKTTPVQTDTL